MKNTVKRKCFIISPLGDDNSDTRKKAEGMIKSVLRPILEDLDFDVYCPHEIDTPGSITKQIISLWPKIIEFRFFYPIKL